jgi:hypothetical protein
MDILAMFQALKKDAAKRSSADWRRERDRMLDADEDLEQREPELAAAHGVALLEKGQQEVRAIESECADVRLQRQRIAAAIPQIDRSIAEAERRELDEKVEAQDKVRRKAWEQMKTADIALHEILEKAAERLKGLHEATRTFQHANDFVVSEGLDPIESPRVMLNRIVNKEAAASDFYRNSIERGASPPHVFLNLPETIPGYSPPVGPPHHRATDLDRMTEISLPR